MATNSNWTVVFDDKTILKQTGDGSGNSYTIDNNSFWNQSKFSNIWAIQYENNPTSDEVEYRDQTFNSTYADANIGDFQTQFIDKWDSAHLTRLQSDWDNNNVDGESNSEKITRLGAKPTSYSS
ncbi:hypothetical protein OAC88_00225 [Flavobacteriaceae bacterium]|nr:hypothetical protein [Flavobacteriaceae bacterium]|tara:strand:- start:1779 stop:2150 length:372 start_codon:yes stop_codon:yes gene_type:complete